MLMGQMGMHKCVFEMSGAEMRLMVGSKGTVVIVLYGLVQLGGSGGGLQMWEMSVDISCADDISIFPLCPLKCASEWIFFLFFFLWFVLFVCFFFKSCL